MFLHWRRSVYTVGNIRIVVVEMICTGKTLLELYVILPFLLQIVPTQRNNFWDVIK